MWLDRQDRLIGAEASARLAEARFAVIGLGGVGGSAAEALVRCGIGNLFLMDGDVFDETNLNRQILCTRDSIGHPKAEQAERRAREINPDCSITAVSDWLDRDTVGLLASFRPDCVIDAVDRVTAKLIIIEWCRDNGVHVVSSMGTGNRTDAESFRTGDISATAGCGDPLARIMRRELRARDIETLDVLYAEDPPVRTVDRTPSSISFVPPVAGYLIAGYAVRHFLGL